MPAAINEIVADIYRTVVAAIGRGVSHSAPRHMLRASRESLGSMALPALKFDIKQARGDAAGSVVIGVPVVVGGCLFLFFVYWFIFLRDRGDEDVSVTSEDVEEQAVRVQVEEPEAVHVPAPRGPAIWVEHMQYRESKSFVLPHKANSPAHPAFGCNGASFDRGDEAAVPVVAPVYRKQNSNFLPCSSTEDNTQKANHAGKGKSSSRRRSRSGSYEDIRRAGSRDGYRTPHPEEDRAGPAEPPSTASAWRRGAISFTEAVTSEQTPGAPKSSSQRRQRRVSHGSDFGSVASNKGNFFDVAIHPHTPARHHRYKQSTPERPHSPSSQPKRAHTPPGHDRSRPAVLEYLLGESAADKAKAREDARQLAEGLRSLALAVDLDGCPPNDFRRAYALLSDIESGDVKTDPASDGGGILNYLGSFVSFSKTNDGAPDSLPGQSPHENDKVKSPQKRRRSAEVEVVSALRECSPAELVRAIERMRAEICEKRSSAGVTTPFQVLPDNIDDSIFIIKATATYLSEQRLDEIRKQINGRYTTQMSKIAELAALELVPCGSIDDHELRRLRYYAVDLVRCCREIQKNPEWVWTPAPEQHSRRRSKKRTVTRELSAKEKFQLALNPHSTIGEISRQNTVSDRNRTVSSGHRALAQESDSDSVASFMSESKFQEEDKSVTTTDEGVARVKSVFSASTAGMDSRLRSPGVENDVTEDRGDVGTDNNSTRELITDQGRFASEKEKPPKTVVPPLQLGTTSFDRGAPSFSVRSEGSFNMASVYDKGLSFQEVSNPGVEIGEKHGVLPSTEGAERGNDSCSESSNSDSFGVSDIDDVDINIGSGAGGRKRDGTSFATGHSCLSNITTETEDSHVYRVTDDKPTPQPAKSPMVPKLEFLSLGAVKPPRDIAVNATDVDKSVDRHPQLSDIANNFGSESGYSGSSDDEDEDEFSNSAAASLVPLGSGRLASHQSGDARTSFGSTGRASFGSVGSEIGVDAVLLVKSPASAYASPRPTYPAASPRLAYGAASPRDEDYPVNKPHRRTMKHSLIPEGHEHVTVVPPSRTSGMVPAPQIYSSNSDLNN